MKEGEGETERRRRNRKKRKKKSLSTSRHGDHDVLDVTVKNIEYNRLDTQEI